MAHCLQLVKIHSVLDGLLVRTLEISANDEVSNDHNFVRSIEFSPDGSEIYVGAEDGVLRVYHVGSTLVMRVFELSYSVYGIGIDKARGRIVAGGTNTIRCWDDNSTDIIWQEVDREMRISSIALNPQGSLVAAGDLQGSIHLRDLERGQLLHKLHGHTDSVYAIVFSIDGRKLASTGLDNSLRIWIMSAFPRCIEVVDGHKWDTI
ncbi:unnamed protein product [Clonostachys rosea]|uniref:Anaphase-promoting complex subunit 4 WD40 domain-containing protein n=1 Tax=Bionectria ochroleuca TaxID=29856 RepID=A0ABY6UKD3_BIOOC|nr:unnamed protein product [Clonostachys rosea]